jgi:hypothetical protein
VYFLLLCFKFIRSCFCVSNVLHFAFVSLLTTHNTNIHASGGVRNRNPSERSAADPRLRPLGHWDRHRTRDSSNQAALCLCFKPLSHRDRHFRPHCRIYFILHFLIVNFHVAPVLCVHSIAFVQSPCCVMGFDTCLLSCSFSFSSTLCSPVAAHCFRSFSFFIQRVHISILYSLYLYSQMR